MKCQNCGGAVGAEQERCPFCGTVNQAAVLKKRQLRQRLLENERLRERIIKGSREYVADRVFNWAILVAAAVMVLMIGLNIASYLHGVAGYRLFRDKASLEAQVDVYYSSGDYGSMLQLMRKEQLFGQDLYKYSQMALIIESYEEYAGSRSRLIEDLEQGRDYSENLEDVIRYGSDVLNPYLPYYSDLNSDNESALNAYRAEILAFYTGWLRMTGEEAEMLAFREPGKRILTEELKEITARFTERIGEDDEAGN